MMMMKMMTMTKIKMIDDDDDDDDDENYQCYNNASWQFSNDKCYLILFVSNTHGQYKLPMSCRILSSPLLQTLRSFPSSKFS